ncbi:MAG: TonB-dependent receptor domain-containing protein [Hyphomicrobium sp.]
MRNAHCALTMTCALATAGVGMSAATAVAQETEILPAIVVEGATLDTVAKKKPKAPKAAAAATEPAPQKQAGQQSAPAGNEDDAAVEVAPATTVQPGTDDTVTGVTTRKLGSPVSVVTAADLKAQQIRNAADALRSLPGVTVNSSGGPGQLTQVRIRGAEANQTLVIIDGVEANDTSSGEFDFSNLSAEDIERIEVLRGVQSGLYGSRALGGVINIVTRGGKGPLTLRGRVEGGSFGTRDVAGNVSAGNERGYFSAGYNFQESNGFNIAPFGTEDDGFERRTFNLRSGVNIVEGISLDFNLRHTHTIADYDDFGGPPLALQTAIDADNVADANIWMGGAKLTWDMLDGGLTHVVGGNFNSGDFQSQSPFFSADNANDRERVYYLATGRMNQPDAQLKHILSGLVEGERETFTPTDTFGPPFGADGVERERNRVAYAAEYRGEYFDRLFPIASVRHENNDTFADFTSWKTAISVDMHEIGIRPHASAGTAYALPGMFQQFGSVINEFIGNPNLVPEESFGWDAGVEFMLVSGQASVDVTYFESDLTNEIVGFGNSVINLPGESQRRGLEVAARAILTPGLVLSGAYTWLEATDSTGLAQARRPEHTARLDLNYAFDNGRGNINVAGIYNGTTPDVAFVFDPQPLPWGTFGSQFVTLGDYLLLNVAASYQLTPGVELYGRVENALNEDYQQVFGYETADVAAYVGLKFTYVEEATRAWAEGR